MRRRASRKSAAGIGGNCGGATRPGVGRMSRRDPRERRRRMSVVRGGGETKADRESLGGRFSRVRCCRKRRTRSGTSRTPGRTGHGFCRANVPRSGTIQNYRDLTNRLDSPSTKRARGGWRRRKQGISELRSESLLLVFVPEIRAFVPVGRRTAIASGSPAGPRRNLARTLRWEDRRRERSGRNGGPV